MRPAREFQDLFVYVHIDEKWFQMNRVKRNFYLLRDERLPERVMKSKMFTAKVVFMAAVAHPSYELPRKHHFCRKIGNWPITYREQAQRNSKKRNERHYDDERHTTSTHGCCTINATEASGYVD